MGLLAVISASENGIAQVDADLCINQHLSRHIDIHSEKAVRTSTYFNVLTGGFVSSSIVRDV